VPVTCADSWIKIVYNYRKIAQNQAMQLQQIHDFTVCFAECFRQNLVKSNCFYGFDFVVAALVCVRWRTVGT
jgi:hypothetical protein